MSEIDRKNSKQEADMKKIYSIFAAVLMLSFLSGCGQTFPESSTLYIQKNGKLSEATIEAFDKDYYDKQELEDFIQKQIDKFEEKSEQGLVKKKSYEVEEGIAKLMMTYEDYQAYTDFTGRELFAGTVVQAMANGYMLDTDFVEVNTDKASSNAGSTETLSRAAEYVDSSVITENDDYKVVILNQDIDVVVKGKIHYVSAAGVTVTGSDTATVRALNDEVSYIVYQ